MRIRPVWLVVACLIAPGAAVAQQVEAKLDRQRIALGETTTLRVTVRGGNASKAPEFEVPPEIGLVTSSRQQSFAWVNGRASVENEFRYEIEGREKGTFSIGPIVVTVGNQAFRSGTLALEVTDAPPPAQGGRGSPATLQVDVRPRDPYVGQEVTLVVRLVQRTSFAEDPQYQPPTTTGFWTDRPTAPESFYADQRGERVLVTETRTRLYPLAVGDATIGEAAAQVVLADDSPDPFGWLGGNRRELVLRSPPVSVKVRPLPAVAPPGFGGAVGRYDVVASTDRGRTSRDVPFTLYLDVRGRGNLPLVRPPLFSDPDVEVLASTVDDSLPTPGSGGPGRKRFQWTLMPRTEGALSIQPPTFVWFDPSTSGYRNPTLPPVRIEVGPPVYAGAGAEAGFPRALSDRPVDPSARPPLPWAFALAGVALGAALRLWGRGAAHDGEDASHAWRARLKAAVGPDLWRTAEEAGHWLESQPGGAADPELRALLARVVAARYAGAVENPELVRALLIARVTKLSPARGARVPRRLTAALAIGLAAACLFFFGPRPGNGRAAAQCEAADQAARRGEVDKARRVWLELWRSYGGASGLAARIAWAHAQVGEIGPASLWVLRGELVEPRDPGLRWVEERVREAGGLVGASAPRWPVRRIEWSLVALLSGFAGAAYGSRRAMAAISLAVAVLSAGILPAQGWLAARSGSAVVLGEAELAGSDVQLEPGQMVTVRAREGTRVHVAAGRVIDGWVPATAVARIAPPRGEDG